jgi:uncharacterized protein YjiS (DUF1127 family)
MLRITHSPGSRDAPVDETLARRPTIGKMLHDLLDAIREGFTAHREYERLMSSGTRHNPALKAALAESDHSRESFARPMPIHSVLLIVVKTIGAWIDRRRQQEPLARLDDRLLRDIGLTRSEHSEAGVKPLLFAGRA